MIPSAVPRPRFSPVLPCTCRLKTTTVTAVVDVRLDDVLDRKHLPPLGTSHSRSHPSVRGGLPQAQPISSPPVLFPTHFFDPDYRSLAIFYSRAKQMFFTPNSPYEIDLPSDVLGPPYAPSLSSDPLDGPPNRDFSPSSDILPPQHNPAAFREVEEKAHSILEGDLNRFAGSPNDRWTRYFHEWAQQDESFQDLNLCFDC